jgi:opacity protein-like surface antigen
MRFGFDVLVVPAAVQIIIDLASTWILVKCLRQSERENSENDLITLSSEKEGGWGMRRRFAGGMLGSAITAAAILAIALIAAPAGATGLGLYLTYGDGSSELDENWDDDSSFHELSTEGDSEFYGGGFVLDTAVALDRVFNYRLNVGFEKLEYEADSVFNETLGSPLAFRVYDLDVKRLVIDNTFGFGIVRLEGFRMWLGPQIRIGGMWGDGNQATATQTAEVDVAGVVLGFAPVLGFNINAPGNVSIGIDLGYRWSFMGGKIDKKLSTGYDDDDSFSFRERSVFINVSLLFRLNENF